MSADCSLVLVTCRSSAVVPAAVASFRAGLLGLGVSGEVVIVDHSEDEGEQVRLRACAPERLLALPNRGYAAGVNAGVAAASGGTVLVGNPDIAFAPDSVRALLDALDRGWDVVGPQFTLAGWLYPPADLQTPGEHVCRWLASRSKFIWGRELHRELRRWRAVWDAVGPVPVPTLSGALLAFRRATFARVGPWDEHYFLYFEETDWLRRAAAANLRLAQVPSATVEHAWGHSADPATSADIFMASRARFLTVWFGWRGRLALRLRARSAPLELIQLPTRVSALPQGRLQWLLSPTGLGFPAAGIVATADDLMRALHGVGTARGGRGRYLVVAADPESAALAGAWSWEAEDG